MTVSCVSIHFRLSVTDQLQHTVYCRLAYMLQEAAVATRLHPGLVRDASRPKCGDLPDLGQDCWLGA